jgi:hypothetical protein
LQVGRVRTEEAILSTVDHPFLATLYGTLQTGAAHCRAPPATADADSVSVDVTALVRPPCLPAHQSVCPHVHPARPADTHLHFLLEYCNGGELYALLNSQPK